jgi:hypothetical protein
LRLQLKENDATRAAATAEIHIWRTRRVPGISDLLPGLRPKHES